MKCEICKWWDKLAHEEEVGSCVQSSPKILLSQVVKDTENWGWPETHEGCWPVTNKDSWCGEFESKIKEKIMRDISCLEFSTRVDNCLRSKDINTIDQLICCSPLTLRIIRNLGATSLWEIKNKLNNFGLSLSSKEK